MKSLTTLSAIFILILFYPIVTFGQWTLEMAGPEGSSIVVPVSKSTFGDLSKASVEGKAVFVNDNNAETRYACGQISDDVDGKISVVKRGGDCDFVDKVLNAQKKGAIAVIVCNDKNGTFTMGSTRADASELEIKSVMMSKSDCIQLSQNIETGESSVVINSPGDEEVLWSDDFSNDSTWEFSDESPEPYGWILTDDPKAMPNANDALFPFASSTAPNGYALIDSDGSPWDYNGAGRIVAEMTTSYPIDLSGEPFVLLRFQHNYKWYGENREVRVSPDNGESWTTYEITGLDNFPDGRKSGNPEVETIDISDVAGNASEVLVQFYYDDNHYWAWYWAVDDVEIVRPPDNDLVMEDAIYPPLNFATPSGHIHADTFKFSCTIANAGAKERSGVEVTVSVINTANDKIMHEDVFILDKLLPGADSLVTFENSYIPILFPDMYIINYRVDVPGETDFRPEDNELNFRFKVTDGLFAKGNPKINHFTEGITHEDESWFWGNMFYIDPAYPIFHFLLLQTIQLALIPTEGTFTKESAIVYILEYVPEGAEINFQELNAKSNLSPLEHPNFKPIAACIIQRNDLKDAGPGQVFDPCKGDFLDPHTFHLMINNVLMEPGKLYGVFVHLSGNSLQIPYTSEVEYRTDVGILYVDNDEGEKQYFPGYDDISGPIIRLGTSYPVYSSTDEMVDEDHEPLNIFPNPATKVVNIDFEMDRADKFKMDIFDMQGKSVISRTIEGNQQNNLRENLRTFQSGNYIIRIISEDGVRTAPLIIVR